jgi:hypothetical protein
VWSFQGEVRGRCKCVGGECGIGRREVVAGIGVVRGGGGAPGEGFVWWRCYVCEGLGCTEGGANVGWQGGMWQGRPEGESEQVPQDVGEAGGSAGGEAGGSARGDDDGSEAAVPDDELRLEKEPPTKAGAAKAVLMGALAHGLNVSIFFPLLTAVLKLLLKPYVLIGDLLWH